jgi:hypothetical protein
MDSCRVCDVDKYAIGTPNLSITTETDDCPICLKATLHKAPTSLPLLPERLLDAIKIFLSTFVFVVQSSSDSERVRRLSGLHDKRVTYLYVTISATRFTLLLFPSRLPPLSSSPNGSPPRAPDLRSIPNMFGWTSEENLVAAKKSLTYCLPRQGTQSTALSSSH